MNEQKTVPAWNSSAPPKDRLIWIRGNLIMHDDACVSVEPFECLARWKADAINLPTPGLWVDQWGMSLLAHVGDELVIHEWREDSESISIDSFDYSKPCRPASEPSSEKAATEGALPLLGLVPPPLALPWPAWHTEYEEPSTSVPLLEWMNARQRRHDFVAALSDAELLSKLEQHEAFLMAQFKFAVRQKVSFSFNELALELTAEIKRRFAKRIATCLQPGKESS